MVSKATFTSQGHLGSNGLLRHNGVKVFVGAATFQGQNPEQQSMRKS